MGKIPRRQLMIGRYKFIPTPLSTTCSWRRHNFIPTDNTYTDHNVVSTVGLWYSAAARQRASPAPCGGAKRADGSRSAKAGGAGTDTGGLGENGNGSPRMPSRAG